MAQPKSPFNAGFNSFFKELAANNHKEWFDANRKRYEEEVRKPMLAFAGELIAGLNQLEPGVYDMEPKQTLFRINRDIRFSKDKSPYKLHMAANFSPEKKQDASIPGLYIQLGPEMVWLAGGIYEPGKEQLLAVRSYIAQHAAALDKLNNATDFRTYFPDGIQGEKSKILPAELKEAAKKQPLIFNKQFYYSARWEPEAMEQKGFVQRVLDAHRAALPMKKFLADALAF